MYFWYRTKKVNDSMRQIEYVFSSLAFIMIMKVGNQIDKDGQEQ